VTAGETALTRNFTPGPGMSADGRCCTFVATA